MKRAIQNGAGGKSSHAPHDPENALFHPLLSDDLKAESSPQPPLFDVPLDPDTEGFAPRPNESKSLEPAQESKKSRCSISTFSFTTTLIAMIPQAVLGALLPYVFAEDIAKKNSSPWSFVCIGLGALAGILLIIMILVSRVALLSPNLEDQLNKWAALLPGRSREIAVQKKESRLYKCLLTIKNVTGIFINSILSKNMSLVFMGLNLVTCYFIAKWLQTYNRPRVDDMADAVDSEYVKIFFTLFIFAANFPGFYGVHQFLTNQFLAKVNAKWYELTEKTSTKASRQKLLQLIRGNHFSVIDDINKKLGAKENILLSDNSYEAKNQPLPELLPKEIVTKMLQKTLGVLEKRDFNDPSLQRVFHDLNEKNIKPPSIPFSTTVKQFFSTVIYTGLGIAGLLANFPFLQRQGIQFLLKEVLRLSDERAIEITRQYADYGGKHLMLLSMSALYLFIINEGVAKIYHPHREINVNHKLVGGGNWKHLGIVGIISLFSTAPNLQATFAAQEDEDVNPLSLLGMFFLITSVLGISIVEYFATNGYFRGRALKKIIAESRPDFQETLKWPGLLAAIENEIEQLPSAEIEELSVALPEIFPHPEPDDEKEGNILSQLSACCNRRRRYARVDAEINGAEMAAHSI